MHECMSVADSIRFVGCVKNPGKTFAAIKTSRHCLAKMEKQPIQICGDTDSHCNTDFIGNGDSPKDDDSPKLRKRDLDVHESEYRDEKPDVHMLAMFAVAERMRSLNLQPVYTSLADNIVPPVNPTGHLPVPRSYNEIVSQMRKETDDELEEVEVAGQMYVRKPDNPCLLVHASLVKKTDPKTGITAKRTSRHSITKQPSTCFGVLTLPTDESIKSATVAQ